MIWTDTTKRSSNIARVGYDPKESVLTIEFKTRGMYAYRNVSAVDHLKFMNQPSLGKAYNDMFYGKPKIYPSTKLSPTSGQ